MQTNGNTIKKQGDSFFVAFKRADNAIHWALSVQTQLLDAKWPLEILKLWDCRPEFDEKTRKMYFSGLRVRIGMHCSDKDYLVVSEKNHKRIDYFGTAINLTSRIESIAKGTF